MHEPNLRPMAEIEDEIGELAARIDAAMYRLLTLIREMDERADWEARGCRSCAHWLSWRIGLDLSTARERVRVAHALAELPKVSDALRQGKISYSKARAITRIATPATEEELLDIAEAGTASHVEKLVRLYRRAIAPDETAKANEQLESRELSYFYDDDGMLVVRAKLTPEQGAMFTKAMERAERDLFVSKQEDTSAETSLGAPELSAGQRRADALVAVCDSAVQSEAVSESPSTQVVVHVEADVLANPLAPGRCELEDAGHASAETCRRLACDAKLLPMIHGKGGSITVGRSTRSISPTMRTALHARDGGCRFPGCACTKFLHGHHLEHWADGGRTDLDNLLELCSFHHSLVHEGGFKIEREANGDLCFYAPDGSRVDGPWRDIPDFGNSLEGLRLLQRHEDFAITSETSIPHWEGEAMDYEWVIEGLIDAEERRATSCEQIKVEAA